MSSDTIARAIICVASLFLIYMATHTHDVGLGILGGMLFGMLNGWNDHKLPSPEDRA